MNKKSTGLILAVAILLGLGTALVVYSYINKLKDAAEKSRKPVVVATKPIKAYTIITADMVAIKQMDPASVAANAATRVEEVVNRMSTQPYRDEDQVRLTDLTEKGKGIPGLTVIIPEGMRAVTLRVDDVTGVGESIQPGNRVDILATYRDPVTGQKLTQIILQRKEVLAIDQAQTESGKGGKGASKSVTLAATPEEAQKLTVAEAEGAMRMMLRPEDDKTVHETLPISLSQLVTRQVVPEDSKLVNTPPVGIPIGNPEPPKVRVFLGGQPPKSVSVDSEN